MNAVLNRVLFVEDDDTLRSATTQSLQLAGFETLAFGESPQALANVSPDFDGIVVSDIRMPQMDGLQLLAAIRAIDPDLPVILITGHGDIPMAVKALHDGAFDFLAKPFAVDHLTASVSRALEHRGLVLENRRLRALAAQPDGDDSLIGQSPAMLSLREAIVRIAAADLDVLVEGETGTGKELVARLLHRQGPRRGRRLVAVNCGALSDASAEIELFGHGSDSVPHTRLSREGLIAASDRGTLLLDDVDLLPLSLQPKLLRVLEEREVHPIGVDRPTVLDLRVIATTKSDLQIACEEGRFRADLFYRLAMLKLRVPPLRQRDGDRRLLFAHFVGEAEAALKQKAGDLPASAYLRLDRYDWPGNVRELRNFAFEAVLGRTPAEAERSEPDQPLAARVSAFEAGLIRESLERHRGNVAATVAELRIPRKTFYDKLDRHGLSPATFRRKSSTDS